jgi:hypothetical protein
MEIGQLGIALYWCLEQHNDCGVCGVEKLAAELIEQQDENRNEDVIELEWLKLVEAASAYLKNRR